MDSLAEIKQIWQTADVAGLPPAADVLRRIKRYRFVYLLKGIGMTLIALALMAVMVWVVFVYKSTMLSTRIGEACMLCALVIIIGFSSGYIRRVSRQKVSTNSAFLVFLKEEEQRQLRFYKSTQIVGFGISSVGLLLYLFEFTYQHPDLIILIYLPVLLWISGCWFLLRPWAMKRRMKKLQETMRQLEALSGQLDND